MVKHCRNPQPLPNRLIVEEAYSYLYSVCSFKICSSVAADMHAFRKSIDLYWMFCCSKIICIIRSDKPAIAEFPAISFLLRSTSKTNLTRGFMHKETQFKKRCAPLTPLPIFQHGSDQQFKLNLLTLSTVRKNI